MNKKYLAILELAKQKEGWKERMEELKFGAIADFITAKPDGTFCSRYDSQVIVYILDSFIRTTEFNFNDNEIEKVHGQFSITDLVEWLGYRWVLWYKTLYKVIDVDGGIGLGLQEKFSFSPGDLQDQPEEVLDKVYNLMQE